MKNLKLQIFVTIDLQINICFGYLRWKKHFCEDFSVALQGLSNIESTTHFYRGPCVTISIRSIRVVIIILCPAMLSFGVPWIHRVFSEGMKQIFLYLLILNFFCFHFYELLSIDIKTNKITAHITVKSYLNKKSNSPALLKDKEKIGKFRIHDGLFTCQGGRFAEMAAARRCCRHSNIWWIG